MVPKARKSGRCSPRRYENQLLITYVIENIISSAKDTLQGVEI